jgi:hypothetical protein
MRGWRVSAARLALERAFCDEGEQHLTVTDLEEDVATRLEGP